MKLALIPFALLAIAIHSNAREHVKLDMGTDFTGIRTSAPVDIYLCNNADSAGFVIYDIEPEVMNNIKISSAESNLTISLIKSSDASMKNFYRKISTIKIYMPQPLENIELSGAGDVNAAQGLKLADNLGVKVSGAGDVDFADMTTSHLSLSVTGAGDIDFKDLNTVEAEIKVTGAGDVRIKRLSAQCIDVSITGSGDVSLDGKCNAGYYSVSGAGDLSGKKLIADIVTAKISGTGQISCYAAEMATATCSGVGAINIYGEPATAKISGKKDNINIIK